MQQTYVYLAYGSKNIFAAGHSQVNRTDVILFSFFVVVGQVEGGDACAQSMVLIIVDGRGRMVHHLWLTLLMLRGEGGVQSMALTWVDTKM